MNSFDRELIREVELKLIEEIGEEKFSFKKLVKIFTLEGMLK